MFGFLFFMAALTVVQWAMETRYAACREDWLKRWQDGNNEFLLTLAGALASRDNSREEQK